MEELFDEGAFGTNSGAELEGAVSVEADPGPTGDRWVEDSAGLIHASSIRQIRITISSPEAQISAERAGLRRS